MARAARSRIFYEGCFAHIYSRALGKKQIFQDEKDFEYFRDLLIANKQRYDFSVFHYCLMHTHFHLAVRMGPVPAFSDGMKALKQDYAIWFHERWKRKGPVWWGGFKGQLIEDERYLLACGHYIEQNPVKAGLTKEARDWPYSSSRHYEDRIEDKLIGPYKKPKSVEVRGLAEDRLFERGHAAGTPLFRFSLREKTKDD